MIIGIYPKSLIFYNYLDISKDYDTLGLFRRFYATTPFEKQWFVFIIFHHICVMCVFSHFLILFVIFSKTLVNSYKMIIFTQISWSSADLSGNLPFWRKTHNFLRILPVQHTYQRHITAHAHTHIQIHTSSLTHSWQCGHFERRILTKKHFYNLLKEVDNDSLDISILINTQVVWPKSSAFWGIVANSI